MYLVLFVGSPLYTVCMRERYPIFIYVGCVTYVLQPASISKSWGKRAIRPYDTAA